MKPTAVFDTLTKHLKPEHPVYKLLDGEYESLKLRAFDDDDMANRFIEAFYLEFDLWCSENGIHHDYAMDHELDYLEAHEEEYLEFAHDRYLDEVKK